MTDKLSDRELDALVAEKVTLWTPIPRENGWQSPDGSQKHWPGPPEYSTSIKDAMEVVEKMRERNIELSISLTPRLIMVSLFDFESDGPGLSRSLGVTTESESLPRAICEAALAVSKENPVTYSREDIYLDHD